jgi:hypothetical protein
VCALGAILLSLLDIVVLINIGGDSTENYTVGVSLETNTVIKRQSAAWFVLVISILTYYLSKQERTFGKLLSYVYLSNPNSRCEICSCINCGN